MEYSERMNSAMGWLVKCDEDSARAKFAVIEGDYKEAYGYVSRMRETIRILIEVDKDLRKTDTNCADRERIERGRKAILKWI